MQSDGCRLHFVYMDSDCLTPYGTDKMIRVWSRDTKISINSVFKTELFLCISMVEIRWEINDLRNRTKKSNERNR